MPLLGGGCGNNIDLGVRHQINITYMYMYYSLVKLSVYNYRFML